METAIFMGQIVSLVRAEARETLHRLNSLAPFERIEQYRREEGMGIRRPRVPAEVARAVLLETGHRCAVCGESCTLETAHILPWSQVKEHSLDNLICLCPNCHSRSHREKWDHKTLFEYKQNPWIRRIRSTPDPNPKIDRIEIRCEMQFKDFDARKQLWLVHALASFLEISTDEIQIRAIRKGSVYVMLELPAAAVIRLRRAAEERDPALLAHLDELGVSAMWPGADLTAVNLAPLPFFGRIAAGRPIEALSSIDRVLVPQYFLESGVNYYVLRVIGDSMVEAGVTDGDFVVIERTERVAPGDLAVTLVGDEVTLKYYDDEGETIVLRPANLTMSPIRVPARDVRVQGVVAAVIKPQ